MDCNYKLVDSDFNTWECSACKEKWTLNEGTPKQNNMNFCPICGAAIVEEVTE